MSQSRANNNKYVIKEHPVPGERIRYIWACGKKEQQIGDQFFPTIQFVTVNLKPINKLSLICLRKYLTK